jgi:O-antigen ligase
MWCLALICVLTLLEYIKREPIWFDYIPSFLKIEGPLFETLMKEQGRAGDASYRARGVFGVHLYFAQFVLMLLPFVVHAVFTETGRKQGAAFGLVLFALLVCWMTNTRTALLGFAVVGSGSVALFGLRRFLNPTSSADMVAPAMFLAAPAGIVALAGLVASSNRLQTMMFGGAQHAGSDVARGTQWDRAIEAFLKNPIGYGGGNAPQIAGKPLQGTYVIDSVWISFLVDTGIAGAVGFAAFCIWTMVYGVRIYLRNVDESADLCGPAAVAIGACMMTMYVVSFFGNFMLLLVMVGAIAATRSRLLKAGLLPQSVSVAKPMTALVRN